MAEVRLDNLTKRYGDNEVVRGIDLAVADKEFVVLVGPSGCGKSTTLRMIAGLESISDGTLSIGGQRVNDLAPGERDIAMVFQNYALYPHMSVAQNIGFGLRKTAMSRAERDAAVLDAARLLEIEPLLHRRPHALSGGQRQRVAMGRAMVRSPQVFLFDEPLSNLDARLRVQMRIEIKRLHQRNPTTALYVTHDQTEAMTMADRVVVMNNGRIEQVGTPLDIYHRPRTRFVAEFVGAPAMNMLDARILADGDDIYVHVSDDIRLPLSPKQRALYAPFTNRAVVFGLRPEDISIGSTDTGPSVHIKMLEPLGVETLAYFTLGGADVCARLTGNNLPTEGDTVPLTLALDKLILIDPENDRVIGAQS